MHPKFCLKIFLLLLVFASLCNENKHYDDNGVNEDKDDDDDDDDDDLKIYVVSYWRN
jgi:hypothetical protein